MKISLCQSIPIPGNMEKNISIVEDLVRKNDSDLYVFPEMFLTGYGYDGDVSRHLERLRALCSELDIAIVIGGPYGSYNSLFFVKSDDIVRYDKIHVAGFGIYCEKFSKGNRPVIVEYKGMRFGLSICYDIFFPELYKCYSVNGADAMICISASAVESKEYFSKVDCARALENTSYLIFSNNIGPFRKTRFFGGSEVIGPLGGRICCMDDREGVMTISIDKDDIESARSIRHHIGDTRNDIWEL